MSPWGAIPGWSCQAYSSPRTTTSAPTSAQSSLEVAGGDSTGVVASLWSTDAEVTQGLSTSRCPSGQLAVFLRCAHNARRECRPETTNQQGGVGIGHDSTPWLRRHSHKKPPSPPPAVLPPRGGETRETWSSAGPSPPLVGVVAVAEGRGRRGLHPVLPLEEAPLPARFLPSRGRWQRRSR